MDGKDVSGSFMVISEENIDSLCPMFFGVSCAFFALRLLPEPEICDNKWSEIRNRMLQGSAHLLGLLVWRAQRKVANGGKFELLQSLERAQNEIEELKKRRSEDAKANEKVACIFAAREQSWLHERKQLRQQIDGLMNDLGVLEMKKDKSISELSEKLEEAETIFQYKDKLIEEEQQKRQETEEKLKKAQNLAEELRESVGIEAQRHSCEISKHKTAFIELLSNQRQLEAEMARAVKQVEEAKQELESVLEQKEQLVLGNQRLSMEVVKMQHDLQQKDQILSAMLRKSKLDTAEKQMLLDEVKSSKAKTKQAELEIARWKGVSESNHGRHSLRNMLPKRVSAKKDVFSGREALNAKAVVDSRKLRSSKTEFQQQTIRKGMEAFSHASDPYLTDGIEEPKLTADVEHLESWVSSEAEKYKFVVEQRHRLNIDAFAEQLRLKDEKLEALRWRLMSMELESKRFQSHIEGRDHDIIQLRGDNMKLEAMLSEREAEILSLKEQLLLHCTPNPHKWNFNSSPDDTVWSKVKVLKGKPRHKRQEMKAIAGEISQGVKNNAADKTSANEQPQDIVLTLESPNMEMREEKVSDWGPEGSIHSKDVANAEMATSVGPDSRKKSNSTWKMDIYSLGLSYKIKRLKQQLLMLERLTGKKESSESNTGHIGVKGFYALMSLLSKQVDRYQSLQGKIDDLCKRMHENNLNLNCGGSNTARLEDETKMLEHFLEETFQLQRYMVSTGQKSMEVQAKIASTFAGDADVIEKPENFDMKHFAGSIRTLVREAQRGLEVRISRIIGDLEGTLTSDGFQTSKK